MTLTRKNRSAHNPFSGFGTLLTEFIVDKPLAFLASARTKITNLPKTNFDLGCDFAESGRWIDALFRFKLALWLQPNYPQAWYNLGCCHMKLRNYAKARRAFEKALSMRPDHADAIFMLSAIDPNAVPAAKRPTRIQKQMVLNFFNQLAPAYDALMLQNQYAGPRILFDTVKPMLKQTNGLHLLDLGCGTGLGMRPWRTIAVEAAGVDFCPAMVTAAQIITISGKPLFDTLLTEDILELKADAIAAKSKDLVLCLDTAQFLGDLAPVFTLAARVLKPGGLAAITVEPTNTPLGFSVNAATGRFGHHPEYVKKAAASAGLDLKKDARVGLYPGLTAHAFVFTAGEAA